MDGGGRTSKVRPWATAERALALWCADWPLVAAGVLPDEPAVVLHDGRTVACTPAARSEGVHRGMRRRDAEARCPHLAILAHDPARDARAFEPVVASVEAFVPRVELTRPGLCSMATRGPSRYFGGDGALASRLVVAVREVLGAGAGHVAAGVADGTFAASLAARATAGGAPVLVLAPGGTPLFLADLPVSALGDGSAMTDLASLLVRLGLRTLGAVAALPEADVVARFGAEGGRAWRRANGLDDRPLDARDPPPDLVAEVALDPPADRVDTAAFAARTLAADLHDRLERQGLACTRLTIEAH
ncbi:MAG: DNA polymerase Y family protein, partial [Acidimicrobiales bacterium]